MKPQHIQKLKFFAPALFVLFYWLILQVIGGLRGDHFTIGSVILILFYIPKLKPLFRFAAPYLAVGIVYDSQRFWGDYIRGAIRVVEPYQFDKTFFGIQTAQGLLTPNEWWQQHLHWSLDLITGFFYLTFFTIYILVAAYFEFWLSRKGTKIRSGAEIHKLSQNMGWAFFALNCLGYSTYYWYPAAPPWYVSMYGLGPARLDVKPNAAGCLRFDELLGTSFFTEMYGRGADVFGAIPSLHVAYPLLSIYFAFQMGSLRAFTIFFYLIMCFSAVYLNHHYILDILWGSSYTVLIAGIVHWRNSGKKIESVF